MKVNFSSHSKDFEFLDTEILCLLMNLPNLFNNKNNLLINSQRNLRPTNTGKEWKPI